MIDNMDGRGWDDGQIAAIMDALPHGSGIDLSWQIDPVDDPSALIVRNGYHCMDPNGFCCGWVDFKVEVRINGRRVDYDIELDGDDSGLHELAAWNAVDPDTGLADPDVDMSDCLESERDALLEYLYSTMWDLDELRTEA